MNAEHFLKDKQMLVKPFCVKMSLYGWNPSQKQIFAALNFKFKKIDAKLPQEMQKSLTYKPKKISEKQNLIRQSRFP